MGEGETIMLELQALCGGWVFRRGRNDGGLTKGFDPVCFINEKEMGGLWLVVGLG